QDAGEEDRTILPVPALAVNFDARPADVDDRGDSPEDREDIEREAEATEAKTAGAAELRLADAPEELGTHNEQVGEIRPENGHRRHDFDDLGNADIGERDATRRRSGYDRR